MARIAIMPARGGSKRIKRKNISNFCGRPLLTYSLAAAERSALFDLIHVSTEDQEIADTAARFGFPPEFLRDPALADDRTGIMAVLKWVIEGYAERGRHFDTVCMVMPTAPLIDAEDLKGGLALFDRLGGTRPVMAIVSLPCPVEWAMRLDSEARLSPIFPGAAGIRSQDLPTAYVDSGTFVFLSPAQIMASPGAQPEYFGYVLPRYKAIDIDTREDLDLAERLYRGGGG